MSIMHSIVLYCVCCTVFTLLECAERFRGPGTLSCLEAFGQGLVCVEGRSNCAMGCAERFEGACALAGHGLELPLLMYIQLAASLALWPVHSRIAVQCLGYFVGQASIHVV